MSFEVKKVISLKKLNIAKIGKMPTLMIAGALTGLLYSIPGFSITSQCGLFFKASGSEFPIFARLADLNRFPTEYEIPEKFQNKGLNLDGYVPLDGQPTFKWTGTTEYTPSRGSWVLRIAATEYTEVMISQAVLHLLQVEGIPHDVAFARSTNPGLENLPKWPIQSAAFFLNSVKFISIYPKNDRHLSALIKAVDPLIEEIKIGKFDKQIIPNEYPVGESGSLFIRWKPFGIHTVFDEYAPSGLPPKFDPSSFLNLGPLNFEIESKVNSIVKFEVERRMVLQKRKEINFSTLSQIVKHVADLKEQLNKMSRQLHRLNERKILENRNADRLQIYLEHSIWHNLYLLTLSGLSVENLEKYSPKEKRLRNHFKNIEELELNIRQEQQALKELKLDYQRVEEQFQKKYHKLIEELFNIEAELALRSGHPHEPETLIQEMKALGIEKLNQEMAHQ